MKTRLFPARALAMALTAALALGAAGCSTVRSNLIREDGIKEEFAQIDPEAGVTKDLVVRIYYRITDESYLAGVMCNVSVSSNERTERAIIEALLEGVPPLANNVSEVMPAGTHIKDVTLDGSILYVTLSSEFFDTSAYDEAEAEAARLRGNGYISEDEYAARVEEAGKEMRTARRMAVCAVVNSVADYNEDLRVQLLFDVDGDGNGERIKASDLGFDVPDGADSGLLEPMEFVDAAVATPADIAAAALARMAAGEFDMAYELFAGTETGGMQKPTYANFETELLSLGMINGYSIVNSKTDDDEASVFADIVFTGADGAARECKNAEIVLKKEGNIYKLGYYSFKALLEG